MGRKSGTAAFMSQGRSGYSTTNFLNRRPRSVACVWADSVVCGGHPPYQEISGLPNELLLTRPRSGISRFQSSVRKGVNSFAERPSSRLSLAGQDETSRHEAQRDDKTRSKSAKELAAELETPNVPYRQASSPSGSLADKTEWERPDSVMSYTSMAAEQSHQRPAGLSRTSAGKYLGLNLNPAAGLPPHQVDDQHGDSLENNVDAQKPRRLRWVPTEPNYLFRLQRYALTSGCTKFVPGRRFVDFVSRNDAYLLADHQRRADEKFHPKSNKLHFSRTSRSVEPGGHEPYVMQTVYGAGGTSYHEFNDLRTVAR